MAMSIDELCGLLDARGYQYERSGSTITAGGSLFLRSLTSLPDGVTLSAGGSLDLGSLTSLPDGVTLSAGGSLFLRSLTSLPDGVTLSAGGYLDLRSLTSLPDGVTLSAGGSLDLGSLTSLPDGVTLSAGSYLFLGSLTSLPDGVTLSAGGSLFLRSLTSLPDGVTLSAGGAVFAPQLTAWRGGAVATHDDVTVLLGTSRDVGGITVYSARLFKALGSVDEMPQCYVAVSGKLSSHGSSIREAMEDLAEKLTEHADRSEVVAQIKERGEMTPAEYRLLTGACRLGLREGMTSLGLDPEAEAVPLADVVRMSAGKFGGAVIAELFAEHAVVAE